MAKPHPFFLWLCFCLLTFSATGTPTFSPRHEDAYRAVLQLKIETGRKLLQPLFQNNAASLLLANYADFLELCVQQEQEQYEGLVAAQEERLQKLNALPQADEWRDYARAEVRLQLAMSKLLFGNRLAAAWDFRKAYLHFIANASKHPSFLPNRKSLGVLQVLIGSVPDKYKWFLSIIGLNGSIKAGMANLQAASTQENPFREEAQLLYAVLLHLTKPEKEQEALQLVKTLATRRQDNLLFQFTAMHLLKKARQSDQALQIYLRRPQGKAYLVFPFLHHMAADLYLFRGDYASSIQENRRFLELHQGQHYLKAANYKLYLAYILSNRNTPAQWHFQQVSKAGIEETEEDRYAARHVQRAEPLLKPLMQARLHSDGGYYREALQTLAQLQLNENTPTAVQAEYFYRKARIYHGTDSLQQALPLYQKAIRLCQGTDLYFAPSACLQAGYIYQQLKQPDKAKSYFKQALGYKHHEYKNSIDAKAKLALSTI